VEGGVSEIIYLAAKNETERTAWISMLTSITKKPNRKSMLCASNDGIDKHNTR
jgi:hypothetical protein